MGCVGALSVRKISSNGAYGNEYRYYSTKKDGVIRGWELDGVKVEKGSVILGKGEGLIVHYTKTGSCLLCVSGEVELTDNSVNIANGYSFSGNATPVAVDLTDIGVKQADGTDFPATPMGCVGALSVRKISANGAYGAAYRYYSTKKDGVVRGWELDGNSVKPGEVKIESGEALIVQYTKTGSCKMVLPCPLNN